MMPDFEPKSFLRSGHPLAKAEADILVNKAIALYRDGQEQKALRLYDDVIVRQPDHAVAWNNLGVALRKRHHSSAAVMCFAKAVSFRPEWQTALLNMAKALRGLGRMDEAVAVHERLHMLYPQYVANHLEYAVTLWFMEHYDLALWHLQQANTLEPDRATTIWWLSRAFLAAGDYGPGFELFEARLGLHGLAAPAHEQPRWKGQALSGKTILLRTEQGFGDTLLGLRFVPWLKAKGAAQVLLECDGPLMRLVKNLSGLDHAFVVGEPLPPHDYQCSLLSLPSLFKITLSTVPAPPALNWDRAQQAKFKDVVTRHSRPTDLKVGIVWSGSITFKNNYKRAVSLDRFMALAALPHVRLFSLQKGPPLEELHDLGCPALVVDLGGLFMDFADTAAALQELDLVIMTDTSVAHLAGCLDVPVWTLLDTDAYWLYLRHRAGSPWYASMRLFRQPVPGDWDAVFDRVTAELKEAAARKAAGETNLRRVLLPF